MGEIPETIMALARATLDKLLCHDSVSCGGTDALHEAASQEIALTILADRVRCRRDVVEEVLNALCAHELYKYRPKAFNGFIEYARAEIAIGPSIFADSGEA